MKLLKKITILLCFLSLIAFVSCSAEDKSGVKEKDNADGTEITGGGKSGNSGTGGGAGTGGTSETGGGAGTGGTSETGGGAGTGGGSGTGETSGTGEGSGTGGSAGTGGGSGTGGSSGTGGGTEITEIGNFPPPNGTVYRDDWINKNFSKGNNDTKVSKLDENTTRITGLSQNKTKDSGARFSFDISTWKKTTKDGKDIKLESVNATDAKGWGSENISIVYYYDSSTLEITFKNSGDDCLFKGTKISE